MRLCLASVYLRSVRSLCVFSLLFVILLLLSGDSESVSQSLPLQMMMCDGCYYFWFGSCYRHTHTLCYHFISVILSISIQEFQNCEKNRMDNAIARFVHLLSFLLFAMFMYVKCVTADYTTLIYRLNATMQSLLNGDWKPICHAIRTVFWTAIYVRNEFGQQKKRNKVEFLQCIVNARYTAAHAQPCFNMSPASLSICLLTHSLYPTCDMKWELSE